MIITIRLTFWGFGLKIDDRYYATRDVELLKLPKLKQLLEDPAIKLMYLMVNRPM